MIAAGVPGSVILDTVRAYEEQAETTSEEGKEKARERWRRWKNKQGTNVGKRLQTDTNVSKQLVRVEDSSSNQEISGKEEKKESAAPKALSDLAAFKADLMADASQEQVEAFAKHRKAKNGQNSAYAARLFRKDAAACGLSVPDAIDTAISRGWLTVKPEYLARRQNTQPRQQSTPPPQRTASDVLDDIRSGRLDVPDLLKGKSHVPQQHDGPTIDASYECADSGGAGHPVQVYAFPSRR
jgi:hypothetical protein